MPSTSTCIPNQTPTNNTNTYNGTNNYLGTNYFTNTNSFPTTMAMGIMPTVGTPHQLLSPPGGHQSMDQPPENYPQTPQNVEGIPNLHPLNYRLPHHGVGGTPTTSSNNRATHCHQLHNHTGYQICPKDLQHKLIPTLPASFLVHSRLRSQTCSSKAPTTPLGASKLEEKVQKSFKAPIDIACLVFVASQYRMMSPKSSEYLTAMKTPPQNFKHSKIFS